MRRRAFTPWLLIASLLLSLWAAAAHEADHADLPSHPDVCVVCAFAHGLGGALPSAGFVLFLLALASTPYRDRAAAPRRAHRTLVRARGPPEFLA